MRTDLSTNLATSEDLRRLAAAGCADPTCKRNHPHAQNEPLFFHATCHPKAHTATYFDPATGLVTTICYHRRAEIVSVRPQ